MRTVVVVLPGVASFFFLAACADKPAHSSGTTTRDSAGVTIVETTPASWPPPDVWRIADTATVDIGVSGGDKNYELHEVKGAIGLADGSTVIAEFGSQLRYYDSKGIHLRTVNRHGEGPGEAGSFSSFDRYRGDSVRIRTGRSSGSRGNLETLLILDNAGKSGRKISFSYPGGKDADGVVWLSTFDFGVQATLEDGSLIVSGGARAELRGQPGDLVYARAGVMRTDANAAPLDTVATVNVSRWEINPSLEDGYQFVVADADRIALRSRANSFYHTGGDRVQVDIFEAESAAAMAEGGPSMRTTRSFRVQAPLQPHTAETKKEYVEASLKIFRPKGTDIEKAAYRARRDSMKTPPFVPAVQDLRLDALGNIWLELYTSPGATVREYARGRSIDVEPGRARWVVLDPAGELLGSVMMPKNLQVFEIGADYVLGLWHDADGIQHVRRHRIVKP